MPYASLRRPNSFEIDLSAVASNVGEIRRVVGTGTQIIAALKGDGYGFGLKEVAKVIVTCGCDAIAVADLADAAELRNHGIDLPILLYAGHVTDSSTVAAVIETNVMPTVFDQIVADTYSSFATKPIQVFVKIDVGLERLGVDPADAVQLIKHIRGLPNLEIQGLYTHVDVPGKGNVSSYISWQLDRYFGVCEKLKQLNINIPIKFVSSSAVLRYTREFNLNAVDPGHILFGLTPPGPSTSDMSLQPVFHALKSHLIHIKEVTRRDYPEMVPFPLRDGLRMGMIPTGLRDGMASLTCGHVLVRGHRVQILGPFSLEHTRIDLSDVPDAQVGDEVVIIGQQDGTTIEPSEVMLSQGIGVKAALALNVGQGIPRVYL
jgi:alanine racemase